MKRIINMESYIPVFVNYGTILTCKKSGRLSKMHSLFTNCPISDKTNVHIDRNSLNDSLALHRTSAKPKWPKITYQSCSAHRLFDATGTSLTLTTLPSAVLTDCFWNHCSFGMLLANARFTTRIRI